MRSHVICSLLLACFLLTSPGQKAAAQDYYSTNKIDIGVVVSDLEESVAFYKNALGMQKVSTFEVDSTQARKTGLTNGQPFHAAVMKLGQGKEATALKLVSVGHPTPKKDSYISGQTGVQYLTLLVTELRPLLKRLKTQNVELLGEAPVSLGGGNHFALIQDPNGVFIELIGPLEASGGQ